MAIGLDGQPLDNARFLWNFGDGALQEGKAITHIYHFPGIYRVNLAVSSGEYTGSDWLTVTVIPAALKLSEINPGQGGFVEIFNGSDADVDLAGINITDEGGRVFRLPSRTIVGAGGAIAIPNIIPALNSITTIILRDARGAHIDAAEFTGVLPAGASWERVGEKFAVQPMPTPGIFVLEFQDGSMAPANMVQDDNARLSVAANNPNGVKIVQDKSNIASAYGYSGASGSANIAQWQKYLSADSDQKSETRAPANIFSSRVFLTAGFVFAIFAALGVLLVKRIAG